MSITFPRTEMGNTYDTFAEYAHACADNWTDRYGLEDNIDITARDAIVRRYAAAMVAAVDPAKYDDIDLLVEDMLAVQA